MLAHHFADKLPTMVVPHRVDNFPELKIRLLNPDYGFSEADVYDLIRQPGHAQAYAGHQFGQFVPVLGDGRAVLLGDVETRYGRKELHVKGAGVTPFARRGDGKAQLGPVLREFLIGEYMHAIGIPTTRSLAALTTGENIMRQALQPGAAIIRVATSHIRVGSFQFAASRSSDELQQLLHVAAEMLGIDEADDKKLAIAVLREAMTRQAHLVAMWMRAGFIHGVMNTDNCAISGETIDYGPCAFLNTFNPTQVFSSIDKRGRYAYNNQPSIAHWNMMCLAQTLVTLVDVEELQAVLNEFPALWDHAWLTEMAPMFGLPATQASLPVINEFFELLSIHQPDYHDIVYTMTYQPDDLPEWLHSWRELWLSHAPDREVMEETNPRWVPRNHLVEDMISAGLSGDWQTVNEFVEKARNPFDHEHPAPPADGNENYVTFCGT